MLKSVETPALLDLCFAAIEAVPGVLFLGEEKGCY